MRNINFKKEDTSAVPLFSVIIPTKNRADLLQDAIKSVLGQTFSDFELLVVDDHSTDDTMGIVLSIEDVRIKYIKNKGNERSAARNTGIDHASGAYLCFLDDDDCYGPAYLMDFYTYLDQHGYPVDTILRTGFIKRWEDGREKKSAMYEDTKYRNAFDFVAYSMCGVWTLCIPASVLELEKFDERFPHWQDTHLIFRLIMHCRFKQIKSYNYFYRMHNAMGSLSIMNAQSILDRCEINVSAIKDLFEKHSYFTSAEFENMKKTLMAEKYMQYAVNELIFNKRKEIAKVLFRKSLNNGFHFRIWKYYIRFIQKYLLT